MSKPSKTPATASASEKLLTLAEALTFLGTSRPTLYRLMEQGKLEGKKVGKQWRFRQADLAAYLERGPLAASFDQAPIEELDQEMAFFVAELHKLGKKESPATDSEFSAQDRLGRLFSLLMEFGLAARASDFHLEAVRVDDENHYLLRCRIDGALFPIRRWKPALAGAFIRFIKHTSRLDPAETRIPQDGRILVRIAEAEVDIRLAVLPTIFGESLVMRLLQRRAILLGLDRLGLHAADRSALQQWIDRPFGLIIVTGPTGSGKTTLQYSLLERIASVERKTITVEDPVELAMPWTTQVQINPARGVTFPAAIRSALRQDPNVFYIGEIRDLETMKICMQAALTGHLVLTTLHSARAGEALAKIGLMGIEPFMTASALIGIVAQRLIRRICPECATVQEVSPGMRRRLDDLAARHGLLLPANAVFHKGQGCPCCLESGYQGRVGLFELLEFIPEIKDAYLSGADENSLAGVAVRHGMTTLVADGLRKTMDGTTSLEEVFRVLSLEKAPEK